MLKTEDRRFLKKLFSSSLPISLLSSLCLCVSVVSSFSVCFRPATAAAPRRPTSSAPLAVVNSPIAVTVNGESAEVLAAVGYPGAVDGYQVNFRVPSDTGTGAATIQISSAWIPGAPVNMEVK